MVYKYREGNMGDASFTARAITKNGTLRLQKADKGGLIKAIYFDTLRKAAIL
jgi:hypothetical protein